MEAAHIAYTLLEANQKNPFFRSPLPQTAQNILDLGTGTGEWARQVADMFPSGTPLLAPLHEHGPGLNSHQFSSSVLISLLRQTLMCLPIASSKVCGS